MKKRKDRLAVMWIQQVIAMVHCLPEGKIEEMARRGDFRRIAENAKAAS